MADTIDDLIRDLAKKGKINHITLSYSGTGKGGGHLWTAAYRDQTSQGYCMHQCDDPIAALYKVLTLSGYRHYPGVKADRREPLPSETKPKRGRDLI